MPLGPALWNWHQLNSPVVYDGKSKVKFKIYFYFGHMNILTTGVAHVCNAYRGQKRVTELNGCESPCRYWELNQGLLNEEQVLLAVASSLQPETDN